jgi:8-oxo-dGTP diphosphatase
MKKYTIGICFDNNLENIVLILKNRPEWQKGKYNFPGGHTEENEIGIDCIIREFREECNIITKDWIHIGNIKNKDNYIVEIFTLMQNFKNIKTMTDEKIEIFNINNLPTNIISNLNYLIPFAFNFWRQGNLDTLIFGTFEYEYDLFTYNSK